MPRKLKVFRTAVGFRDAYVAAPSRAAALRAWGTSKDLFARGAAEEVSDPALAEAALAASGDIVYRTRGSLEEQVAALGDLPKAKGAQRTKEGGARRGNAKGKGSKAKTFPDKPRKLAVPRPSRAEWDAAEQALAAFAEARTTAEAEMQAREQALAAERSRMEQRFDAQRSQLEEAAEAARAAYQKALRAWEP